MGFALGEGEKPGEVTRKSQVLSPTQLLPFSTRMYFPAFQLVPICGASCRDRPEARRERGP